MMCRRAALCPGSASSASITSFAAASPIWKAGISIEVIVVSSMRPTRWPVRLMILICSGIFSPRYAAGELKHGTIALIEENQPVIAVCCNEAISDKTLSNIVEVKARGAKVLALAFRDNRKIVSQADDVIFIPRVETIFSAVLAVVPLQLLAYYAAKEKGCDIDKPKNLAKSVTVE